MYVDYTLDGVPVPQRDDSTGQDHLEQNLAFSAPVWRLLKANPQEHVDWLLIEDRQC